MIKNIACRYTQEDAKEILDALGFRGQFDWIYMPRSPNMQSNLGYVFINFRSKEDMDRCKRVCHGKPFGNNSSLKLAEVVPAHIQGDVQAFARIGRNGKNKARAEPLFVNDPPETEGPLQERSLSSDFWSEASSAAPASDEGAARGPERGRSAALYDACSLTDCPSDDPALGVRTVSSRTSLFEGAAGADFSFFEGGDGGGDWAPAVPVPKATTAELLPATRTSSPGCSGLEPVLAPPGLHGPTRASPASTADSEDGGRRGGGRGHGGGTTVMLKNIACQYTVESIKRTLDELGLRGTYDDVYIPRSQARQGNLGYAFVNFLDAVAVEECRRLCHGHPFGHSQSQKVCEVVLAHIQAPGSEHSKVRKPKRKPQPANLSETLGSYGSPQGAPFALDVGALQGDHSALLSGSRVLLKLSV